MAHRNISPKAVNYIICLNGVFFPLILYAVENNPLKEKMAKIKVSSPNWIRQRVTLIIKRLYLAKAPIWPGRFSLSLD